MRVIPRDWPGPRLAPSRGMRRFIWLATLLAGCDARSSAETAIAFVVLFGTLAHLFVDHDAR